MFVYCFTMTLVHLGLIRKNLAKFIDNSYYKKAYVNRYVVYVYKNLYLRLIWKHINNIVKEHLININFKSKTLLHSALKGVS